MTSGEKRAPVAAVGVVCLRDDSVLLVRRAKPPRAGKWSLPGGRIEWGERARDAALRELMEETGVEAEIVGLVDVVDAIAPHPISEAQSTHHLLVDYAARWRSGQPKPGDDAVEARFFPIDAIDALGLWRETMRVIGAARALVQR